MYVHGTRFQTEELISSADYQVTKAIIFSQFLGALSLLEEPLRHDNIGYLRLDGSMSLYERAQAVRDFARMPQASSSAPSVHAQAPFLCEKRFPSGLEYLLLICAKMQGDKYMGKKREEFQGCSCLRSSCSRQLLASPALHTYFLNCKRCQQIAIDGRWRAVACSCPAKFT